MLIHLGVHTVRVISQKKPHGTKKKMVAGDKKKKRISSFRKRDAPSLQLPKILQYAGSKKSALSLIDSLVALPLSLCCRLHT